MRWILGILIASVIQFLPNGSFASDHFAAVPTLISSHSEAAPGDTIDLALQFKIRKGWHIYWKNPGDSGLAPTVSWQSGSGVKFGPFRWPAPHLFKLGPLLSYGYSDTVTIPFKVTIPSDSKGNLTINGQANWIACEVNCVPEAVSVSTTIRVGNNRVKNAETANQILAATQQLPKPELPAAVRLDIVRTATGQATVRASQLPTGSTLAIYPEIPGTTAIPVAEKRTEFILNNLPTSAISVPLVVILTDKNGSFGYQTTLTVKSSGPTSVSESVPPYSILSIVVLAFLGGLLLNLMPCVFPVLSIKILSMVRQSNEDPKRLKKYGLMYSAGIVSLFLLLAGMVGGLKSASESIGWGFQLQSPAMVAGLIGVCFTIALNLLGVFEFGTSLTRINSRGSGYIGAFLNGVLIALVATPCTGPFMGTAIGYTLTQSLPVTFVVFTSMAIGFSLPYLMLAFRPSWISSLPKPGSWMTHLKEILAFPMLGTTIWLLWVLTSQIGLSATIPILWMLLGFGLLLWAYGKVQTTRIGWVFAGLAAAAFITFPLIAIRLEQRQHVSVQTVWQPYSQEKVIAANQNGQAVFVDFSAAWCLTCQFNKQTVLNRPDVLAEFKRHNVLLLKADWTNRDPEISAALKALGRNGVPTYAYYPIDAPPFVLPELLTAKTVISAIR